ncbi:hypothetical protein J2S44_008498 [Catenuloplanes niger]|uniref:Uncharacterized protein n=1 Tax=Catenuloplanes niger TaxID=587534 RepID=A0AAE3ZYB1_9ACTN|nr:hypothetical protein [Catenuloplanes niger]
MCGASFTTGSPADRPTPHRSGSSRPAPADQKNLPDPLRNPKSTPLGCADRTRTCPDPARQPSTRHIGWSSTHGEGSMVPRIHVTADDLARVRLAPAADPAGRRCSARTRSAHVPPAGCSATGPGVRDPRLPADARLLFQPAPPVGYSADFLTPAGGSVRLEDGIETVPHTPRHRLRTDLAQPAGRTRSPRPCGCSPTAAPRGWPGSVGAGSARCRRGPTPAPQARGATPGTWCGGSELGAARARRWRPRGFVLATAGPAGRSASDDRGPREHAGRTAPGAGRSPLRL